MRVSNADVSHIKLITKHKGFVRLALSRGISLVPMFSFGENLLLENIYLPKIQEWFQKRIFYGFPHLPYGRWFTPIPNRIKMTLAVGKPIALPKIENPTMDQVDFFHKLYFDSLLELFHQTKRSVPGFENSILVYLPN